MIQLEKITLKIDGMVCSMCESHINEAVRRAVPVKKVTSSHRKGETVVLMEDPVDEKALREAIDRTGYRVMSLKREPYERKGHFARLQG